MEKNKDRDEFMAIDDVEEWIEESDSTHVSNTLFGVMDYITEIELKHVKEMAALRYAITIEAKTYLSLSEKTEKPLLASVYLRAGEDLTEILDKYGGES